MIGPMDTPETSFETGPLPDDPAELLRLLEDIDPAESPDLVAHLTAALERALADVDPA